MSALDELIANKFRKLQQPRPIHEQKLWLKTRDQCDNEACIKSEILKRIDETDGIDGSLMYNKVVDCWQDTQRTPDACFDIFFKYVKRGTEIKDFSTHDPMRFSFWMGNKKYSSTYDGNDQIPNVNTPPPPLKDYSEYTKGDDAWWSSRRA